MQATFNNNITGETLKDQGPRIKDRLVLNSCPLASTIITCYALMLLLKGDTLSLGKQLLQTCCTRAAECPRCGTKTPISADQVGQSF